MAKKMPKTYHHGDLRETLVKAGRAILEKEGAAALTLRACARKAGVSHAAPQHHFETAADLLAEIAATGFDDFVKALDEGVKHETRPSKRLVTMAIGYVAFAKSNPAIYMLMFGTRIPRSSQRLQVAMTAAWIQLADAVKAASGADNVDGKATHVWSLVHGFSMLTIAGRLPPHVDEANALNFMAESLPRAIGA
jgi:AcrR family transcriptional regulator